MASILFVCMANRYRSPIAEACFREEIIKRDQAENWHVSSAGTWTKDGLPPMPDAAEQAERLGLDISKHLSREISVEIMAESDLVIVMEQGQKEALWSEYPMMREKIYMLAEATIGVSYDIPDPVEHKNETDVPAEICDLIRKYYDKIVALV